MNETMLLGYTVAWVLIALLGAEIGYRALGGTKYSMHAGTILLAIAFILLNEFVLMGVEVVLSAAGLGV